MLSHQAPFGIAGGRRAEAAAPSCSVPFLVRTQLHRGATRGACHARPTCAWIHASRLGSSPSDGGRFVVQQPVADDARGEGGPGFSHGRQAVGAGSHPPQALRPTDGRLDGPADLARAAAAATWP